MKENTVLVSVAIVVKQVRGGLRWFIAKLEDDSPWELPKTTTKKGESSVRASIRTMEEMGGMSAQVLEEAGRAGGVTTVNGNVVPQRHLYYLMIQREAGETIGFAKYSWLEYSKAVRKLAIKRDQTMLRAANKLFKQVLKEEGRI